MKHFQSFFTNLSSDKRNEIKAKVLLCSSEILFMCESILSVIEFENHQSILSTNFDNIFNELYDIVDTACKKMIFTKTDSELRYLKSRIEKYALLPINFMIKTIMRDLNKALAWNWDNSYSREAIYNTEEKIQEHENKIIRRLQLIF